MRCKQWAWALTGVAALGWGTGCSRSDAVDAAKARAETEALRAEVDRLRAQHNELRAEVEALRVAAATAGKAEPPVAKSALRPGLPIATRLEAIQSLVDTGERQKSYFILALDAASLGDVETNKKCISALIDTNQRQDAIYKSALRLAAVNKASEALAMAKTLIDTNQRQQALAKIAQGEFKE